MHPPRFMFPAFVVTALFVLGGAASATPPGQSPPTNTGLPTISGTAQVGQTLTGTQGTWSGPVTGYRTQWNRCDSAGANCSPLSGATSGTYAPASGDVGLRLRVSVTAFNKNGSTTATSDPTAAVTSGGGPDTTPPTVALTSPAHNPPGGYTQISGTVALSANASDNVGVASVAFYFGSTLIATDTAAPYTASFDTSTQPVGQTSTMRAIAKDAAGNQTTDQIYVQVASSSTSSTTISPSTLAGATAGTAYSQQLSASGPTPPYSFKVSQGSLPSGLSLTSGGLLAGTPSASGSSSFTVAAANSTGATAASQAYALTVAAPGTSPTTISPSTLAGATAGTAYSQQLSASGPTTPYSFKVSQGSIPSGLSLSSGGLLSGTPSASGSFSFTVAAADSTGATDASQAYTLSVASAYSGGSGAKLKWAPPGYDGSGDPADVANYPGYLSVNAPQGGGVLSLDNTKNYVIHLGHPTWSSVGSGRSQLEITGGHNRVIVGGQITVNVTNKTDDALSLLIDGGDPTGITHIEGVLFDSSVNAITLRTSQTVQIENVRVENNHIFQDDTSAGVHPDLIQTWGGANEIRIDHFSGHSDYTGLSVLVSPDPTKVQVYNTDLHALAPQPNSVKASLPLVGGSMAYMGDDQTTTWVGSAYVETGYYSSTGRRKIDDVIGYGATCPPYELHPGTGLTGSVYTSPLTCTGGSGTSSSPSNLGMRQGDYECFSRVSLLSGMTWMWGTPSGGDYVPAGVAGVNYVSPGYQ